MAGAAARLKPSSRTNGAPAQRAAEPVRLGALEGYIGFHLRIAQAVSFQAFAREVAMHIAASPSTQYVSEDDIPQEAKDAELRVFEQQAADKPEHIRPKIAEGKLKAWMNDVVLLNQPHVNTDKYEGKTIEELRSNLSGTTGENVVIRRFARFAVGA